MIVLLLLLPPVLVELMDLHSSISLFDEVEGLQRRHTEHVRTRWPQEREGAPTRRSLL